MTLYVHQVEVRPDPDGGSEVEVRLCDNQNEGLLILDEFHTPETLQDAYRAGLQRGHALVTALASPLAVFTTGLERAAEEAERDEAAAAWRRTVPPHPRHDPNTPMAGGS